MHAWPFQYDMCIFRKSVIIRSASTYIFVFLFPARKALIIAAEECRAQYGDLWNVFRKNRVTYIKSYTTYKQFGKYHEVIWQKTFKYVFLYLYHHHENCSNDNFAFLSFFSLQMLEYLIISTFLCNTALVSWTCTMYSCVMLHNDCSSYCPM